MNEVSIEIKGVADTVAARQAGRQMAQSLGFGSADQTRLATAISELTRNVVQHAGSGTCVIEDQSNHDYARVRVVVEDHGPGIPDPDQAMEYGVSSSGSLGAGLPGAKRLVHEFEIQSEPGHTMVSIVMTRKKL